MVASDVCCCIVHSIVGENSLSLTFLFSKDGQIQILGNNDFAFGVVYYPIFGCIPYWALHPQENIIYVVLGQTLPGLASGLLFAIPYWTISRSMRPTAVSNYMIIAGIGIILFQFSTTAGVYLGPYPPFGLYSVSLTGLSCFFMLIGIYFSAISAAQDSSLRKRIHNTSIHDSELPSIGAVEMEQTLQKKVGKILRENVGSNL